MGVEFFPTMQVNVVTNALEKILKHLEPFLPLVNCHMVDFLTQNAFEKHVPAKIQAEFDENILNAVWKPSPETYPELYSFIETCKKHTVHNSPEICLTLNDFQCKLIDLGCGDLSGFHLESFMSSKKSHEVEIMSEIASAVSCVANTTHIVDIGDGKGYLSSALALHSHLKVLGVDSSVVNTRGAAKRITKLKKNLAKKNCEIFYKQTTKFITENDTNLKDLLGEYFPNDVCERIGVVGLHTCGDLAATCLKIFHSDRNIKSICNVGCCYHLLAEDTPMSDHLKATSRFHLGRNARMLAAQSLDRILFNRETPSKILMYRAVLQVLLRKHAPGHLDCQVGRLRHGNNVTFNQYVRNAFVKFNCDVSVPSDREISQCYEMYKPSLMKLQFFYLIRAHLAPVVESVMLLDRLLFLRENGYANSFLVRLFDPVISPRCCGVIAIK